MPKACVARVIRRAKIHTRIETNDGRILSIDSQPVPPFVGMELDFEMEEPRVSELRPLCPGDKFPELLPFTLNYT